MPHYISVPTRVEAWETANEKPNFGLPENTPVRVAVSVMRRTHLEVFDELHDTWVKFELGDFIIKGTKGEFYPCKPDVFAQKYRLDE